MLRLQVNIALIPGGCLLRHPDATLAGLTPEELKQRKWRKNDLTSENLRVSFWLHNARCVSEDAVLGTRESPILNREDLKNEAVEFFCRFVIEKVQKHRLQMSLFPSVVCFPQVCVICALLQFISLSDGYGSL